METSRKPIIFYIESMNEKYFSLRSAFPEIKPSSAVLIADHPLDWEVLESVAYTIVYEENSIIKTVILTTVDGCDEFLTDHQSINLVDIIHRGTSINYRVVKKLELR